MNQDKLPTKTINIPSRLHQQLKVQAALEGESLQDLIVQTLSAALGIEANGSYSRAAKELESG